jgi:predicted acetyltransferase
MAAFRTSIVFAQERYFDSIYGPIQLSLAQLATHPDYQRRGAASMMMAWGIARAEEEKWPITVFGGAASYKLYVAFGFKTLVTVTTQVLDEEEKIEFPGMAWEPSHFEGKGDGKGKYNSTSELLVVFDSNSTSPARK